MLEIKKIDCESLIKFELEIEINDLNMHGTSLAVSVKNMECDNIKCDFGTGILTKVSEGYQILMPCEFMGKLKKSLKLDLHEYEEELDKIIATLKAECIDKQLEQLTLDYRNNKIVSVFYDELVAEINKQEEKFIEYVKEIKKEGFSISLRSLINITNFKSELKMNLK